ncbi:MAG: diguanylate cyclase [Magnetococcales bacterium]|nr:diguanylate cyclase [Magnetococcales bacterium]
MMKESEQPVSWPWTGFFKAHGLTLSIRRMLMGLGLVSGSAILLLAGVALVSNHRMAQYQEELLQEAFPVSEAVRGVLETVMRLTDRQHEMMTSTTHAEFIRIPSRIPLEKNFQQERHNLDKLLERFPASRELLGDLDRHFDALLDADTRLTEQREQWLQRIALLEERTRQVEQEAEAMIQQAEALAGKARLEGQRTQRRLRPLLEKGPGSPEALEVLRQQWQEARPDLQEATARIRHGSLTLALLSRQLIMERHQDLLISIRSNGIDPALEGIRAALSYLQEQVPEHSELHSLTLELEAHYHNMPRLLVADQDSLYALLHTMFQDNEQLRIGNLKLTQASARVLRDVERLSSPAGLLRGEIATDARQVVQANRWTLILVSLLAPVLLAGAIFFFLRWLMGRTVQIIYALQGCAEGDYSRRVPLAGNGDQLDEIGATVNTLAQTLDRLESADVRSIMSRIAINALLETSLLPLTLQNYLMTALRIIRSVPWLRVWNNDIAIFLVDKRESEALRLVAHIGFSNAEQQLCAQVASGHCLCGTSLATGQIVFADNGDERHVIDHDEAERHGHYCIPILSSGRPLGVLTLHLDEHHHQNPDEIALLTTIAHTLAGVIERKRMEEHLQHLAHHDPLTGLPNRTLFREHAEQLLSKAIRSRSMLAVMLLDLDRFKQVNDTLGHAAGDQLLLLVTQRIKQTLRASDLLARLGGDEFGLVIEELPNPLNVAIVAEKIVHSLMQPFMIQETSCAIGVSIGIALFPEHGETVEMLLVRADRAMYGVKQNGRNGFRYARLEDMAWEQSGNPDSSASPV